jgi:hypothetical protein
MQQWKQKSNATIIIITHCHGYNGNKSNTKGDFFGAKGDIFFWGWGYEFWVLLGKVSEATLLA